MEDTNQIAIAFNLKHPAYKVVFTKGEGEWGSFYHNGLVRIYRGDEIMASFRLRGMNGCCGMRLMMGLHVPTPTDEYHIIADCIDMLTRIPMLYLQGNKQHYVEPFLEYYGATRLMKHRNDIHNTVITTWCIVPRPGREYVSDVTTEMEYKF